MTDDLLLVKRASPAKWTELNPVLRAGEVGYEKVTHRLKFGDGTTEWNDLDYATFGTGEAFEVAVLTLWDSLIQGVTGDIGWLADQLTALGVTDTALISRVTAVEGDPRWTNARTPTAHGHVVADVTGFTAAVDARVQNIVDAAPAALDTLNELAAALGDDANYAATITTALSGKQPLDPDLTAIAALTPTNDDLVQRKAGAWTNRTPAQVKVDLAIVVGDVTDAVATTDPRLSDARTPTAHTHPTTDVTGFNAAVDIRIQNIVGAAPAALDTLDELAAALGDDANFAGTVITELAGINAAMTAAGLLTQKALGSVRYHALMGG